MHQMTNEVSFGGESAFFPERIQDDDLLLGLAELYRMFADSTRIRILCTLTEGEMNVSDITAAVGMTQSAVSHQLRILKDGKLIRGRRDGRSVRYSLADDHVKAILQMGVEHLTE